MRAEERNCSPKLWKAASGNTSVCERVFTESGEIRRKAAEAKKKHQEKSMFLTLGVHFG